MIARKGIVCTTAACLLNYSVTATSVVEHWSCVNGRYTQEWTIVDNRMFAPKGKGSMPVILNTPQVATAYFEGKLAGHVIVYVLDKIAGKMVTYDNLTASVTRNAYGESDPEVTTIGCKRID